MRRHHEELVAAAAVWPALSLLIPFSAALWTRIKTCRPTQPAAPTTPKPGR
jgi:hypothetical protein